MPPRQKKHPRKSYSNAISGTSVAIVPPKKTSSVSAGVVDSGDETESDDSEVEDDQDESEDNDDDDDDDDESTSSEVNVDFIFSDPRPIDFKSVRRLLERYLPGEEGSFPVGSLADDVIGQRVVGTMVKVVDDGLDDSYAFSTILPLSLYSQKDWFRSVKSYLLKKVPVTAMGALKAALDSPSSLGLLLNERIYNMPPELAPSLHESVLKDVAWAMENAPGDVRAAFQDIKQVLVLAPCWLEKDDEGEAPANKGGKKKGATGVGAGVDIDGDRESGNLPAGFVAQYLRFEEKHWASSASLEAAFSVALPAEEQVSIVGGAPTAAAPPAGRKRTSRGKSARTDEDEKKGEDEPEGRKEGNTTTDNLRAPQIRRVLLLPINALSAAQSTMATEVEEAKRRKVIEGRTSNLSPSPGK